MATALKLVMILVLFYVTIFLQGADAGKQCDASSIQVETVNSGARAGSDTVFEVEVRNLCPCAVRDLRLDGGGFATSVAVDPALFRRSGDGDLYLVNGGKPIASRGTVTFRYAWDHFFKMTPRSLEVDGRC